MELLGLHACLPHLQFWTLQTFVPFLPVLLAENPGSEGPLKHTRSQIQKCTTCDKDTISLLLGCICVCTCVCACCYMYVGKYMCACGRPQLSVSLPQLLFLFTEIRLCLSWGLTARLVHQFAPGPLTLPFIINWFILRMHTWSDLSCKWSSCWAIFPAPNRMWRAFYDIAVLQRQE